jgi:hypothetical protein
MPRNDTTDLHFPDSPIKMHQDDVSVLADTSS